MLSDRYRFILGAIVLTGILSLAIFVALGHVEEKSSYGLTGILTILAKVVLDFSEWAFRSGIPQKPKEEKEIKNDSPPNETNP